jgi:ABC-type histidine transport system ATPase subunit
VRALGSDRGGAAMAAAAGTVLQGRGMHKAYGRHRVLSGADLEVRAGQLVAVVGESGAGNPVTKLWLSFL